MIYISAIARTPRITALQKKLKNLEPVNRRIGEELMREVDRNFREEGIWGKWAPLARATTYKRDAFGMGRKPLDVSGKLKRSIKMVASGTRVRLFSTDKLAVLHHEGREGQEWWIWSKKGKPLVFPHPQGKMGKDGIKWIKTLVVKHKGFPARPILPHAEAAKRIARNVVDDYLAV